MIDIECVPCKAKKNKLKLQLIQLRQNVKIKAVNEGNNYAIWFDVEDEKLYHATIEAAWKRGVTSYEVLSKYP